VGELDGAELPKRFGHCLSPQAQAQAHRP